MRLLAAVLALAMLAPPAATAAGAPADLDWHKLSSDELFVAIRARFRSHRPPPAYEVYTIERKQLTDQGFPDYLESYKDKLWVRNSDRASLKRQIFRGINRGYLEFERPAFNEERDPGPPTADVFEPAPLHPHPVSFVPTPEPVQSEPPIIGRIYAKGVLDYRVDSITEEGDQLHLIVLPNRDPDRNRLREIWCDAKTLELHKLVATDKLFILGTRDVYGVTFTITMGSLDGIPVVTDIHGVVGDGYSGDGATVDYFFRNISFPETLPDWYFDTKLYASHQSEAPS